MTHAEELARFGAAGYDIVEVNFQLAAGLCAPERRDFRPGEVQTEARQTRMNHEVLMVLAGRQIGGTAEAVLREDERWHQRTVSAVSAWPGIVVDGVRAEETIKLESGFAGDQ